MITVSYSIRIILISALVFFTSSVKTLAQNAKEELRKINLSYDNFRFMNAKVSYNIYQNELAKIATKSETGQLYKRDSLVYNRMGSVETIINSNYHVVVDNDEKVIQISKRSVGKTQEDHMMLNVLEKAVDACTKVVYESVNENTGKYIMECPFDEYKKMELTFDRKKYLIEKIALFLRQADYLDDDGTGMKEPPRIEIVYNSIDTKTQVSTDIFSEKKYLAKNAEEFSPIGAYKDYTIINLVQETK